MNYNDDSAVGVSDREPMAGGETEWIAGSSRTRQAYATTRLGREAAIFPVDAVHSKDMESRRADYRSMHSVQQMFTASIIWLCRGGKDNVWLGRGPCTWLACRSAPNIARKRRPLILDA
jgi:hypothetical protein